MIWSIAWRNVWRNKKRSTVLLVAVAFGLWAGILNGGITWGMVEQMIHAAIDVRTSHVQIHHPEFRSHKQISDAIPNGPAVLEDVRHLPDVKAAAGRIVLTGMAGSPATAAGVMILGIEPSEEAKVTEVHNKLLEGDYFATKTRNPVVISKRLAENLGVRLGNKIVLTAQATDGSIVGGAFRIAGIYKTVSSQYDKMTLFTLRKDLEALFELDGVLHEIALLAPNSKQVEDLRASLKTTYPDLEVASWMELEPEMALMIGGTEQWIFIFIVIILLALVFGITNTMLMGVLERVRELGVVMALGMNHARIFAMILLEAVFLSGMGGVFGLGFGALTIAVLGRTGIDLSIVQEGFEAFGMSAVIFPSLPFREYPIIALLVILSAILASIYPAVKAVRLSPTSAIRTY
ncbi:MAG: FtsX-like permease family protein [bacterium]